MEQHYKRYKGSQKHFNLWMLSETEEFYPTQISNDPLKKISEYIKSRPTDLPEAQSEKDAHQRETKKKPAILHSFKPDFNVISYWEKFLKGFNLQLAGYLGVRDTLVLASTCKYFQKALENEDIWVWFLRREYRMKMFDNPRKEEKELRSIRLYYKYLYIKEKIGISYHTGYFQEYGTAEVGDLVDGMVDFMVPRRENIKGYVSEIMMRNKSKMNEIRLSWLKETGEICLWNADFSITFEEKEVNKKKVVEKVNKFYPCFIKKYLVEGKIEEAYFLEDQYLVIKFLNQSEQVVFRVLDMAEEFYSMGRNWVEPAVPFDYIIVGKGSTVYEKKEDEKSVSFTIEQGGMTMKLLKDNTVVFFTENEKKGLIVYWDLKEKKEIALVQADFEAPIYDILCSKREIDGVLGSLILDEEMNVYCVNIIGKELKEVTIDKIFLPKRVQKEEEEKVEEQEDVEEEDDEEESQEVEEKDRIKYSYESKANRRKKYDYDYLSTKQTVAETAPARFEDKTRKYSHELLTTKNEEWLIIHHQENFHFINLDKKQLIEFELEEGFGNLQQRNWNIYKDKLYIFTPTHIFCHQISFEEQKLSPAFYRKILIKDPPPQTVMAWMFQDECWTILATAQANFNVNSTKLNLIVMSTQELNHNDTNMFHKGLFTTNDVLGRPDRWEIEQENFTEKIQFKFQNEKFFVMGERSSYYFDLSVCFKTDRAALMGWNEKIIEVQPISNFTRVTFPFAKTEEPPVVQEEEEEKDKKPRSSKLVNYVKLEENRNGSGAKEKGNGWSKNGKSDWEREKDQEKRTVKGKGDKYFKNIRQGKRSEKVS